MATAADPTGAAAIATAYFEAIAAHDPEAMKACWAPDGVDELHGLAELRGPQAIAEWFGEIFSAMPDFEIRVLDALESGEKVAIHWRATGSFDGPGRFQGLLANGSKIDMNGCDVLTVRDGKIQRNDAYLNGSQMAQQLGAMPPSGSAQERAMIGAVNLRTRLGGLLRR